MNSLTALCILFAISNSSFATFRAPWLSPLSGHSGSLCPRWLSFIPDNVLLNRLTIPGIGNTLSTFDGLQSPHLTIPNLAHQLRAGVRALDLRGPQLGGQLGNLIGQQGAFGAILDICQQFLREYPEEALILLLEREALTEELKREALTKSLLLNQAQLFWQGNNVPRLGDVRGKIVLIDNANGLPSGQSDISLDNGGIKKTVHIQKVINQNEEGINVDNNNAKEALQRDKRYILTPESPFETIEQHLSHLRDNLVYNGFNVNWLNSPLLTTALGQNGRYVDTAAAQRGLSRNLYSYIDGNTLGDRLGQILFTHNPREFWIRKVLQSNINGLTDNLCPRNTHNFA